MFQVNSLVDSEKRFFVLLRSKGGIDLAISSLILVITFDLCVLTIRFSNVLGQLKIHYWYHSEN